ncbi:hypothetical protein A7K91_25020 [Paenibacillus oryzae]|uniref:Type II secretion system protein GspF domain-containing protein n=1 Tax=Paenibacillus oryzae TaxID=1844972 RepID=A0A1A5YCA4_9BACL|nr:hypothetical protein [Paenibacillus oryzae]OBR63219.1 hypothetical protein A7K91_25020 [Paenibacillus oryzae]
MHHWMIGFVGTASLAGQFLFGAAGFYALLAMLPRRPGRWRRLAQLKWRASPPPERLLKLLGIKANRPDFQERSLLLAGCGITDDPGWYAALRRLAMIILLLAAAAAGWFGQGRLSILQLQLVLGIPMLLAAGLKVDRMWLRSLAKMRSLQMTGDIYRISNQLLYLCDSSLHIHAKLTRCIPLTGAIRGDLERLLAEWYHDPALALKSFKERIGSEDGLSFAETLDALRLHESSHYYSLLRARIGDYKEKLELAKEGRKESASYLLFVVAGLPILYTFQVFIYPWVMEGQKLFQSLG